MDECFGTVNGREGMMKTYYPIALCTALVFGGAVITGLANVSGRAKENSPSIDLWLVKGRQIEEDITNGQVLLRRKFNVVITEQTAESLDNYLDGMKNVENDFPVRASFTREPAEDLDFEEAKGRSGQFGLSRTDRAKLLIILSMYLHSRTPIGHG